MVSRGIVVRRGIVGGVGGQEGRGQGFDGGQGCVCCGSGAMLGYMYVTFDGE